MHGLCYDLFYIPIPYGSLMDQWNVCVMYVEKLNKLKILNSLFRKLIPTIKDFTSKGKLTLTEQTNKKYPSINQTVKPQVMLVALPTEHTSSRTLK
jgi:hypothetical protein